MQNKHKQFAVLTIAASLLAVPFTNTFAQSISPFGKGNPIQLLSEQLDGLEDRVGNLEISPIPTSISGLYESTMIGNCLEVTPAIISANGTPSTAEKTDFYPNMVLETLRFYPDGKIDRGEQYTLVGLGRIKSGNAQVCAYRYEMTTPPDGTFTWISNEGITNTECEFPPYPKSSNPWTGELKLQGRIFDGGKTLTLRSEELSPEKREDNLHHRQCIRTNTLRKISN